MAAPNHNTAAGAGWSSPVARQPHKLEAAGSNPAPVTIFTAERALLGQVRRLNELLDERDALLAEVARLRRFRARGEVRAALRLLDGAA